MTVFLLLAGLLLAVTLALLLPPLLRTRTPPALSPHIGEDAQRTHNVDAYRQRLAALEEEVRAGDSSRHEFERARLELQRELLQDVHAPEHRPAGVYRRTPVTAAVVALLVPLLALALYVAIGSPDALDPAARAPLPETALPDEQGPMLEEMVANLAERLRQQPDDADGWQTLARSYAALGRHAAAVEAFSRAHDLSGEDPQLLVDWAESVALDGGGRLTGEPRALIERALALEPDNGTRRNHHSR